MVDNHESFALRNLIISTLYVGTYTEMCIDNQAWIEFNHYWRYVFIHIWWRMPIFPTFSINFCLILQISAI